ncbi:hypothetical protein EDB89DRAFT_1907728 [Lactarius sanguifluus]|nr:hypothetical protein EDB89DRAFT_1907728 [Lactarius sanguifluus]
MFLVSAYFDRRVGQNPSLKHDFPLIPWYRKIVVLFVGKRKPFYNGNGVQDHPEPELQGVIPILSTQINVSGNTCQVESCKGHTRHYQISVSMLQSLAELEKRVMAQTRAMKVLMSQPMTSPPTKSLVDEIKTHH